MNAPATFFDKILTFAGDEIRPEYKLTGYKLSDDRRKIKFTDGFKAGEFDLWCNQKTLVGSSRLCVIIFAYVRLNAYWARLLGLF